VGPGALPHRPEVVLDGPGGDSQVTGDLLAGQAVGCQPQHLGLPEGQMHGLAML
jgi:hypothetical protein